MTFTDKLNRAYNRGGTKEIFRGGTRLGLKKIVQKVDIFVDENKVLTSEEIIEGTTKVSNYHRLPTKEGLAPLQRSESRNPFDKTKNETEFLQDCQYTYRPDFVCELENIRLLGPKGIGITGDGLLLEDSIVMPGQGRIKTSIINSLVNHPFLTMETLYTSRRSPGRTSQTLDCACSLFGGWNNYYHWIVEHLPKLRAVEYYKEQTGTQPTIIIPNDPPSYIPETLELLNIQPSNCVQWDPPAIDIRTFILPSYPEANPENLHWLRTKLRDSIQENESKTTPNRIYISREKAPTRQIKNEEQLFNLLSDFGFQRVYAEDLSVSSQIRLFSNADILIGPHGAGLTNMIWGDEMKIFEIHYDYVRDVYSVLANNLGHDYIPIQGSGAPPNQLNSDIIVDVEQIESILSGNLD